mmetsp:Transcript_1438/g.3929  ORF Transcript_1438/g.3929 Transcript_1438/m.3929 type:complete len:250 (-) Transcript_1438:555-1304(-)
MRGRLLDPSEPCRSLARHGLCSCTPPKARGKARARRHSSLRCTYHTRRPSSAKMQQIAQGTAKCKQTLGSSQKPANACAPDQLVPCSTSSPETSREPAPQPRQWKTTASTEVRNEVPAHSRTKQQRLALAASRNDHTSKCGPASSRSLAASSTYQQLGTTETQQGSMKSPPLLAPKSQAAHMAAIDRVQARVPRRPRSASTSPQCCALENLPLPCLRHDYRYYCCYCWCLQLPQSPSSHARCHLATDQH